jgi:hypothetical protein
MVKEKIQNGTSGEGSIHPIKKTGLGRLACLLKFLNNLRFGVYYA